MSFIFSRHLPKQAKEKRIDLDKIQRVLNRPDKITKVSRYPGQTRYIGEGIAIIVAEDGQTVITVYLDRVFTPLRADQIAKGEIIKRTR